MTPFIEVKYPQLPFCEAIYRGERTPFITIVRGTILQPTPFFFGILPNVPGPGSHRSGLSKWYIPVMELHSKRWVSRSCDPYSGSKQ